MICSYTMYTPNILKMAVFQSTTVMQGHTACWNTFNADLIVPESTHQINPINGFSILITFQKSGKCTIHQQWILGQQKHLICFWRPAPVAYFQHNVSYLVLLVRWSTNEFEQQTVDCSIENNHWTFAQNKCKIYSVAKF